MICFAGLIHSKLLLTGNRPSELPYQNNKKYSRCFSRHLDMNSFSLAWENYMSEDNISSWSKPHATPRNLLPLCILTHPYGNQLSQSRFCVNTAKLPIIYQSHNTTPNYRATVIVTVMDSTLTDHNIHRTFKGSSLHLGYIQYRTV